MPEIFATKLVGPLTVGHVAAGLVVVLIAGVVMRVFGKAPVDAKHLIRKRCAACGWSGSVSKFNLTCPKCAKKL